MSIQSCLLGPHTQLPPSVSSSQQASYESQHIIYEPRNVSFTFHITKPSGLKTTGVHRYIRRPSYSALLVDATSMVLLLFRADGLMGCWVSAPVAQVFDQLLLGWAVMVTPALFWVRVKEEEEILAKTFGKEWEGYCARTKRFIPGFFKLLSVYGCCWLGQPPTIPMVIPHSIG
ncbi:hypothetical protein BDV12DRAFT_198558 [Aspergillus spectabilis]